MKKKNDTMVAIERNQNLINDMWNNPSGLKYIEENEDNKNNKNITASNVTFGGGKCSNLIQSNLKSSTGTARFGGGESNVEQSKEEEQKKESKKTNPNWLENNAQQSTEEQKREGGELNKKEQNVSGWLDGEGEINRLNENTREKNNNIDKIQEEQKREGRELNDSEKRVGWLNDKKKEEVQELREKNIIDNNTQKERQEEQQEEETTEEKLPEWLQDRQIDEMDKKLEKIIKEQQQKEQQKDQAEKTGNNLNNEEESKNKEENINEREAFLGDDETKKFLADTNKKIKEARTSKNRMLRYCIKLTDEIFEEQDKKNLNEVNKLRHYFNILKIIQNSKIKDIKYKTYLVELYNTIFIKIFKDKDECISFIQTIKNNYGGGLALQSDIKHIYHDDFGQFVRNFESSFQVDNFINFGYALQNDENLKNALNNYIKDVLSNYKTYQEQYPIKNEEKKEENNTEQKDDHLIIEDIGELDKEENVDKKKKKVSFADTKNNEPLVEIIEVKSYKKYNKEEEEKVDERQNNTILKRANRIEEKEEKFFYNKSWKERSTGSQVGFILSIFPGLGLPLLFNWIYNKCSCNCCATIDKESINKLEDKKNNIGK